jgi:hypothetical protein
MLAFPFHVLRRSAGGRPPRRNPFSKILLVLKFSIHQSTPLVYNTYRWSIITLL